VVREVTVDYGEQKVLVGLLVRRRHLQKMGIAGRQGGAAAGMQAAELKVLERNLDCFPRWLSGALEVGFGRGDVDDYHIRDRHKAVHSRNSCNQNSRFRTNN
jgi:hypothetical protein